MKKTLSFALAALLASPATAAPKKAASKQAAPTQAAAAPAAQAAAPAAVPAPVPATPAPPPAVAPAPKDAPSTFDLSAAAYGGAFDGMGVWKDSGSMLTLEASGTPEVRRGAWSVEAPLRVFHRETFGASLSETVGAVDVAPWLRATESLRLGLEAGLLARSRPDWPDLYQPDPGVPGALLPTDRYSYLAWRAGVQAYARPARHQHLRLRYRYAAYDYADDPQFNPNAIQGGDPMHLTPGDNGQHQVDVSWSYRERRWALVLRLDYTRRNEDVLLARTARTGSTRAGGTGTPLYATPLQRTSLWEPSAELRLEPLGSVELSLRYGLDVQDDLYQGYYSYTQHHPRIAARWAVTRRLAAAARYEGWLRTYGPNGTEPVSRLGTVKLDYGSRRTSSRIAVGGDVEYALGGGLRARASLDWVDRGTNYADYVPGVNSRYDIDWDYTNVTVLAGLEYRL